MDVIEKDLRVFLEYYVRRESNKEHKFIVEQKKCQLQLCVTVNHSNCPATNPGKDLLMINTKLIQLNHEEKENSFYIKSQKVSHCIGLTGHNSDGDHKVMSVQTVITRANSECETVFMTSVTKAQNGKRLTSHRSFTREIIDYQHNDDCINIHDNFEVVFSDSENSPGKKTNSKKNIVDKTFKKPFLKSIKLPKLSKKKSLEKRDELKYPTVIKPILGNRKLSLACMQDFSTEFNPTMNQKPRNILAKISVSNKTHDFEVIDEVIDDTPFMDEENENDINNEFAPNLQEASPTSDSYFQFNLSTCNNSNTETADLFKDTTCNCEKRRISILVEFVEWKLRHRSEFKNDSLNTFNEQTRHFSDCHKLSSGIKNSNSKLFFSSSQNSIFHSDSFNGKDQLLTPEFNLERSRNNSMMESVNNLDKILDNMKRINKIQCSIKHVNYFKSLTKYQDFEKQLLSLIGQNVSVENFSLILYMIRSIIQHTDDPNTKDNEIIQKIMNFSTEFLIKFYGKLTKDLGGIDKFIRNDDVD